MSNEESKQQLEEVQPENEIVDETNEEVVDQQEESAEQTDEEKTKAKAHGHMSLEQFVAAGGRPEDYKTEKEFNLTGEVIELKKTLQKRDKDIEEILKYQQHVIEQHKIKMRQELDAQLRTARDNGDMERVEQLAQQKAHSDYETKQEEQQRVAKETAVLNQAFLERNSSWYNDTHPELKARAHEIDNLVRSQYPTITYAQLLNEIERSMRYELGRSEDYRHLVVDPSSVARPVTSAVNSAVARSATKVNDSDEVLYSKLNGNQKARYNSINRMISKVGAKMTVKEFLADEKRNEEI